MFCAMARTSPSQFEVMVDFMERNGDLNKPADGPSGRLRAINKWKELSNALNLDATGSSKPVEKWKKVWSDLKNNTKRKASRIQRVAGGTGGGPACKLSLTDLEQRVLNIVGPQAATGLINVQETVYELFGPPEPPEPSTGGLLPVHTSPTPLQELIQVESIVEDSNRPGEVGQSPSQPFNTEMVDASATSPTLHHALSPEQHPGPRRAIRGRRRLLRSPAPTPPHSAHRAPRRHFNSRDEFLKSDEHWRNLATEFVTENLRLREVELQRQAQWQTLFAKFIALIEIVTNKINM